MPKLAKNSSEDLSKLNVKYGSNYLLKLIYPKTGLGSPEGE